MTYPTRPWWTPVRLELAFGAEHAGDPATWSWTDVSADLDPTQSLTISRGRPDESGQTRPTSVSARLVNNDSAYTPGHPASPHYPHVRQGVPARISVQAGGPYLRVPGTAGGRARVASSPSLDVTDLDVRVDVALDRVPAAWGAIAAEGWRPYAHSEQELIGRYTLRQQRMWVLLLDAFGVPMLRWSTTGDEPVFFQAASEPVPVISGQRIAIRATLDVDDGAGAHVVTFYTAPSLEGPWRRLGQPATRPGTTSIYQDTEAPLDLGEVATLGWPAGAGRYYGAELRSSIDGPLIASPDFTTASPGDTTVTDPQGNAWSVMGGAEITDWRVRMTGEVADWAPTWPWGDLSDPARPADRPGEARCDITIAGPLRRLGQGAKPLQSTLRRRIPSYDPIAYWPMEEDREATQAYSPIEGVAPMATSGVQFATVDTLPGSSPLPTLTDAASIRGVVPAAPAGQWRVEMVYELDQLPSSSQQFLDVRTTGSPWNRFEVRVTSTAVQLIGYDTSSDGGSSSSFLLNSTALQFAGEWSRLALYASEAAGIVTLTLRWATIGGGSYVPSTTYSGTAGRVTQVLAQFGPELQGMPIGHFAVFPVAASVAYEHADDGFTGERALARMRRLAEEEHLPLSVLGPSQESPAMGPQRPATVLTLLQECADVDGGVLAERREWPGLMYRPRQVLYNQTPGVVLNARASEIDNPFSPVLDDQRLRNDITVSRTGGSAARAVDEESINASGIYDETVTVNAADDAQLDGIATWRLHQGTWPGMRYPAVTSALDIAPRVLPSWLDRLEGDRIQVGDLPPQHPDETVDLMIEGLAETLTPTRWTMEAAASPGGPWVVGEIPPDDPGEDDGTPTHVDTDGTELAVAATETATVLYLRTTAGPEWVTSDGPIGGTAELGDLPLDLSVAGEVVRTERIEPLAWDIFDRTVTDGWGETTTGLAWTSSGGPASDRSVTDGQGVITLSSPVTQRFEVLPFGLSDVQTLVTITPSAVAVGAPLTAGVVMRVSGSDYYRVRVLLNPDGTIAMDASRASSTIGGDAPTPVTYSAGTELALRVRLDGDRLRARVWAAAGPESAVWWLDRTVTTDPVPLGLVGVVASAESGNTNTSPQLAFSAWQVVNPQYAEVTRSVNGIRRAHAAGTDVRLARPMIVAL